MRALARDEHGKKELALLVVGALATLAVRHGDDRWFDDCHEEPSLLVRPSGVGAVGTRHACIGPLKWM